MAGLSIHGASKSFGETHVLRAVDVEVGDGEFAVIVGPSGCGKSTLLRAVAGLEQLDEGQIRIGDRQVDDLAPSRRGIAMVFQSYALYPHLTVYENMAFALRIARVGSAEIDAAVRRAADILNISDYLDRKPAALSGGQRQRVAIGRAIVRQPNIFLFDEPLSNLDADLRARMRYEFAELHRQLGTTTLYVTHDQVEAMTLADRIIVMREGQVEQAGPPRTLYDSPANLTVAQFLGTPRMNILSATVEAGPPPAARLISGDTIPLPEPVARIAPGAALSLGIRPDDIEIGAGADALPFTVTFIERLGGFATVHLRGEEDMTLILQHRDDGTLREGEVVPVRLPAQKLHLFDAQGLAIRGAARG
ncbi:sn-glycerol-3-phosphate ABC transporter ATP-binding protein UgpC [Sphingomonas sp.]|uniref:ABC transporter ATP-binding protein n=1 Tax=Sphingomonas sp. TaxID=28214 RepID=UPI001EB122E8|nr:sn-glycerol-3-phosphate ABC transporter ATP-binding protein UgpC [Sphingomonas sp.]MBX3594048.1 sn-glycerol-3-phosphate ABC transporter ATP-binding protein UgpC [Sphingomonas sp.]